MKLMEVASPFGVFLIGVIVLGVGYFLYISGVLGDDPVTRDAGPPIENLGITLMAAGIVLYIIVTAAKQALERV
ncbi:MAG: hypothetical protein PHG85_02855 [Candidatus Altiarchaeota archaeon]|nr:hypothetical protein [Candidatus Altiarchaeota archaeon]